MNLNHSLHFQPTRLADVATFPAYAGSLSSPIDSFLEDHIAQSKFYAVAHDGQVVGHFAIHDGALLTQFYLVRAARRLGMQALLQIRRQFNVVAAFVPTCDEFFLSHALDDYATLKMQACFFAEADPAASLAMGNRDVIFRPAHSSSASALEAMCGDFLDRYSARIANNELHVGHLDDELVALGVIERSALFPGQASIGMFTRESRRGRGIGTSTITYMRGVCHIEGLRPIAGCGYSNALSRKTLEAAGMVTATRLLRFEFSNRP